jgi:CheY-like chemotaxis protein
LELSLEPIAIDAVIKASLNMVRPQATHRGITIEVDRAAESIFVTADRQRFGQVLLNLISNAVKYNSANGSIKIWPEISADGRVRIAVRDTGAGIPPDKLSRLFNAFDRLGAEKSDIEGSGLGLALSKNLAEAMGGTLGVASEVGRGSTFWLELPQASDPVLSLSKADDGDGAGEVTGGQDTAARYTLLYIEDNKANFALIEAVLQHRPAIDLLKAMLGSQGLEIAREARPDLILLDLHLPDMEGYDILRTLQREKLTEDIPVFIISADATNKQRDRLLAAGARMYLTKPLVLKDFLAAVDSAMEERFQDRKLMTVD